MNAQGFCIALHYSTLRPDSQIGLRLSQNYLFIVYLNRDRYKKNIT